MMKKVRIVAPAYQLNDGSQLKRVRTACDQLAAQLNWSCTVDDSVRHLGQRGTWAPIDDRQAAWEAACTEADLVWTTRGGYGCMELLAASQARPPALLGYSDVTALHVAQWNHQRPGWYGPNADTQLDRASQMHLFERLQRQPWSLDHQAIPGTVIRQGEAQGLSFAGCLRILAGVAGTPWQPDLTGAILWIEDIDERPYSSDRDLRQMFHAGMLDGIVGLVASSFPHTSAEDYGGPSHADIFTQWANQLKIPAVFGIPFGHDTNPFTIGLRWPTHLKVTADRWHLTQDPTSD